MKINGIGTIKKEEAMKILTREGREAVKSGEITTEELGRMYKLEMVKKLSKIGKYGCNVCRKIIIECRKKSPISYHRKRLPN